MMFIDLKTYKTREYYIKLILLFIYVKKFVYYYKLDNYLYRLDLFLKIIYVIFL